MRLGRVIAIVLAWALVATQAVAEEYPYVQPGETADEHSAKHCYSLYQFLSGRLELGQMDSDTIKLSRAYDNEWRKRTRSSGSENAMLQVQHKRKIATGLAAGTVLSGDINRSLAECVKRWGVTYPDNVSRRIAAGLQAVRDDAAMWEAVRASPEGRAMAARLAATEERERTAATSEAVQETANNAATDRAALYGELFGYMRSCMGMQSDVSPVHPQYGTWRSLTWKCEEGRSDGIRTARANGHGDVAQEFASLKFPWE